MSLSQIEKYKKRIVEKITIYTPSKSIYYLQSQLYVYYTEKIHFFFFFGSCLNAAKSPARGKLSSAEKGEISKIYGVIYVPAEFFII